MDFEARVWCENGDLLGYVMVEETTNDGFTVSYEGVDPESGYNWAPSAWATASEAVSYAKEWAAAYEEYWQSRCDCGESDCGALTLHGIFVEYCRDGFNVDE